MTKLLADEGYTCGLAGKLHLTSAEKAEWRSGAMTGGIPISSTVTTLIMTGRMEEMIIKTG